MFLSAAIVCNSKHLYTEVQIKLCTTLVLLLCESECCMMTVVAPPHMWAGFESRGKGCETYYTYELGHSKLYTN